MLKKALQYEWQKLFHTVLFKVAILIGLIIAAVHFTEVAVYVREYWGKVGSDVVHPNGLSSISLKFTALGCDGGTISCRIFPLLLPILAALPYGISLCKERKSGYQLQAISRVGKRKYLIAKGLVGFASGFIVIFIAMLTDTMLCACICPLSKIDVASMMSFAEQGTFFSEWFYTHPILFLFASILLSSVWGGISAIVALASEILVQNRVLIMIGPFLLFNVLGFLTEIYFKLFDNSAYIINPIQMLRAFAMGGNPAWYLMIWQLGFLGLAIILYYRGGMKRENL